MRPAAVLQTSSTLEGSQHLTHRVLALRDEGRHRPWRVRNRCAQCWVVASPSTSSTLEGSQHDLLGVMLAEQQRRHRSYPLRDSRATFSRPNASDRRRVGAPGRRVLAHLRLHGAPLPADRVERLVHSHPPGRR